MRLTKEIIIKTASDIANQNGLSGVSLKNVAATLHTSTPSLYNHIDNLEQLLHEIAHVGMNEMNHQMMQSAIGISGDSAIIAVSVSYLKYMITNPGVYETIQWVCWHPTEQTLQLLNDYDSLLEKAVSSYELCASDLSSTVCILKGFIHGYTTQQLGNAIKQPDKVITDLTSAMQVVLLGIHQKYKKDQLN